MKIQFAGESTPRMINSRVKINHRKDQLLGKDLSPIKINSLVPSKPAAGVGRARSNRSAGRPEAVARPPAEDGDPEDDGTDGDQLQRGDDRDHWDTSTN